MPHRNIIVIGASSGGFETIKRLVLLLPADLQASIFIVWHMSPDIQGVLPEVLNRQGGMHAQHAVNNAAVELNTIYVAPVDHHLILQPGVMRLSKGPKENRFRPAVDPLFRSAAVAYGSRVIGVILSGALDDGTSGLRTIKSYGGIAVVQDPMEADFPSMPRTALESVQVDYCLPIAELAPMLEKLIKEEIENQYIIPMSDEEVKVEIGVALQNTHLASKINSLGKFSAYACPQCHGVLTAINDGGPIRYRCHTGHAFSSDSLLAELSESIESSIWSAIRGVEESMMLLNQTGDFFAENNQPKIAALYFQKANEASSRMQLLTSAVFKHEQLSREHIIDTVSKI